MIITTQNPELKITQLVEGDALEHFAVIERNRDHLAPWLPWVPLVNSIKDVARFIAVSQAAWQGRHELACALRLNGRIVGGIGIVDADLENECVSLGYWLDHEECGRGLMTTAARALTQWCFADLGRHRVQIRAARNNVASRSIPERLDFMEEGLLRQSAIVAGIRQDMVLYARLRTD
ncbi:MAG: putative acetyltransferase family [Verrucomicrobiaceae bacterium]|nr:putative acetyltransferase family [Verrucomicrobiaceae bacterium]